MDDKKSLTNSIKFFLVSGALTGTVWIWSLFANKTVQDLNKQKMASNHNDAQPPQVTIPVATEPTSTPITSDTAPTTAPSSALRVVNIAAGA